MRHGPRHAAQKSTSTGTLLSRTISSNSSGPTGMGSATAGSCALHAPQRPMSARCLAGIRFGLPQDAQFRTTAMAFPFRFQNRNALPIRSTRRATVIRGACAIGSRSIQYVRPMTFIFRHSVPQPRPGIITVLLLACAALLSSGSETPKDLSRQIADAAIRRWPAEKFAPTHGARVFNDQSGTLLSGMNAVWYNTAGRSYYQYIQDSIDPLFASGAASDPAAFSLHSVMPGRQLLLLYRTTLDKRYYEAAAALRRRVSLPPASESSGSVEKQDFPDPARPDELYLAEPFLAEYASVFHQPQDFAGITRQFLAIEQQAHRDPESGLLYRAWDRSRQGTSPTLWAQGLGWYMMALVDSVPLYPEDDPGRAQLIDILKRTAAVVVRYQDAG